MPLFEGPNRTQNYLDFQPDAEEGYVYVFVHGGCFSGGNPGFAAEIAKNLSDRHGERVIVPNHDTRSLSDAIEDVALLIQHLLGDDPKNVVLCGGSSGGYIALAVSQYIDIEFEKLLLFCPVADPNARYDYLLSCAEGFFTGVDKPGHKDSKRAIEMVQAVKNRHPTTLYPGNWNCPGHHHHHRHYHYHHPHRHLLRRRHLSFLSIHLH